MKVQLIGWTAFTPPSGVDWGTDATSAQALIEFAGRACYQSWSKPNPDTATNEGYIRHIIDVQHFSVLEHSQATFYITGVSRSLTHELIRHRHLSFSQLSQRFVEGADFVEPQVIADDPELHELFIEATADAEFTYYKFAGALADKLNGRKLIRQAARSVLPNATETKIVVTGNFRAWREFIEKRTVVGADVEIRGLAYEILRQLQEHAPNVFGDIKDEITGFTSVQLA